MKTRRVFLMFMACTLMLAFAGVTIAKAELEFESVEGTWWKTLKQMDKGYISIYPAVNSGVSKAKRAKFKQKDGYMFIPPNSFDDASNTYIEVIGLDPDGAGGWITILYDLVLYGGTPNDMVGQTVMSMEGVEMVLTVRATLKEDKKNPGTIKSGNVRTLGSSMLFEIPPDMNMIFAGSRDFNSKWIPVGKVPQDVYETIFPPGP